jgi:hypothetical protein
LLNDLYNFFICFLKESFSFQRGMKDNFNWMTGIDGKSMFGAKGKKPIEGDGKDIIGSIPEDINKATLETLDLAMWGSCAFWKHGNRGIFVPLDGFLKGCLGGLEFFSFHRDTPKFSHDFSPEGNGKDGLFGYPLDFAGIDGIKKGNIKHAGMVYQDEVGFGEIDEFSSFYLDWTEGKKKKKFCPEACDG